MSSRALRRAEQEAAAARADESEEETPYAAQRTGGFSLAALGDAGDDDDETGGGGGGGQAMPGEDDAGQSREQTGGGKKKKKNKPKKKKGAAEDDGLDEIDRALAEIGELKPPSAAAAAPAPAQHARRGPMPWTVDIKFLNPEAELKRMFGSKTINAEKKGKAAPGARRTRAIGGGRILLTTMQDNWPPATERSGLSMAYLNRDAAGSDYFRYEHAGDYSGAQYAFQQCVEMSDIDGVAAVVEGSPYLADALLMLSDVCKQQDQLQQAADLIERALFGLEMALHPDFDLAAGTCRLPFTERTNRTMFLALFKHAANLSRKGCPRTALEVTKLLWSLDPDAEPLCTLLSLDFYAFRAGEYAYLRETAATLAARRLDLLPNWAYTLALAEYHEHPNDRTQATRLLTEALIRFPALLPVLAGKVDLHLPPSLVYFTRATASPGLEMLLHLYVERASGIWRGDELGTWLLDTAQVVQARASSGDATIGEMIAPVNAAYVGDAPLNICRHVLVAEFPAAMSRLPRSVTERAISMSNPLPPEGEDEPPALVPRGPVDARGVLMQLFESLLPWTNVNLQQPPPQ